MITEEIANNMTGNIPNPKLAILERENKRLKGLLQEGAEIAKAFQKETGMVWGERIGLFLKDVEGKPFSVKDYHYEKPCGEQ